MAQRSVNASYIRNFIFGVEDSLVSTVGLLSGVAIAGMERREILLTGIVLIFVEAFSMAMGSFIAEHSAEDYLRQREVPIRSALADGAIMFVSYFISGFVPLSPYILLDTGQALNVSILFSIVALFVVGFIGARLAKTSLVRGGVRMMVVGGIAIAVGVLVGKIVGAS